MKHSVCSSNVIPLRHYFGELFQIDEMMLEKGFQNVEVEPIIIVNCYVAKPDHGLEAPAKGGLNDLRGFQEYKVFLQTFGQTESLVSHDVGREVDSRLHGPLKIKHEDILNV